MPLYLGFDSSTQSVKAMIVDSLKGEIVASEAVNFGRELPEFGCPNGALENPDPLVKRADPLMWLAGLELALAKLVKAKAPLARVEGVGGSAQQHGTVYLNAGFPGVLAALNDTRSLAAQLKPALARAQSPIWMDSSTSEDCRALDAVFWQRMQADTGSPAIERFAGPQIRKFARTEPDAYAKTARIHLVSSFLASVLCGAEAPIEHGDGAGMNLLNLKTLSWDVKIAAATAPGLLERLPKLAPTASVAGRLHRYFAKYGLRPGIPVAPFTGDNPASLVGTGASKPGLAVLSLGTSDTFFAAMKDMASDPEGCGHVFGNPAGGFMSLICFKNGSLARESLRDRFNLSWDAFDSAVASSRPGDDGCLMLPYLVPEITPVALEPGLRLRGTPEFEAGKAPAPVVLRAILESQALSMRRHSRWIGQAPSTIRVTGGGSRSAALKRVFADVFQARIETISVADSAALGAAMIAARVAGGVPFAELASKLSKAGESVEPDRALAQLYAAKEADYAKFEKDVVSKMKGA